DRELITYLPHDRKRAHAIKDVFLEGLAWRSRESFFPATAKLLNFYLRQDSSNGRDQAFDALVGLATKHDHPWSSERLYGYLAGMDLRERDSRWTEYLRTCDERSVVFRTIEWIERTDAAQLRRPNSLGYIRLLALFLTTTRRTMRDRVTRALVTIGQRHPSALFSMASESLTFNDPYVPERMLAASYGIAMRMWADPDGEEVRSTLPAFAADLLEKMFVPGAPYATKHALMRDSAIGTISLAQRVAPECIPARKRRYLGAPFAQIPSPFPPASAIDAAEVEAAKSAFRM